MCLDAEYLVATRQTLAPEYQGLMDLMVYNDLHTFHTEEPAAELESYLRKSGFGECSAGTPAELEQLTPGLFCRLGQKLVVKPFQPFTAYIFQFTGTGASARVSSIMLGGKQAVVEAELPGRLFGAVNLDSQGRVQEHIRFEPLLGKEVDDQAPHIKFLVEIEDKRFASHRGTDWQGLARAMGQNVKKLFNPSAVDFFQGGSSLTEQVAKRLFLPPDSNKFVKRVLAFFIAEAMERRFTKKEILTFWLNTAVLGVERPAASKEERKVTQRRESIIGFKAAARELFNKQLSDCTLSQLAFLAVLPRNPFIYPNLKKTSELNLKNANHRRLEERRQKALTAFAQTLTQLGHSKLAEQCKKATKVAVKFDFSGEDDLKGDEAVAALVERDLKGALRQAGVDLVTAPKPIVAVTSLDPEFQADLSRSMESALPGIKKDLLARTGAGESEEHEPMPVAPAFSFDLQVEVVAMSVSDGALLAFSSLKTNGPRVIPNRNNVNAPSYLASLAKPFHLSFGLSQQKVSLQQQIRASDCHAPDGFTFSSQSDERLLSYEDHLIHSRNPPFICLANEVGIENIYDHWREVFPKAPVPKKGGKNLAHRYQLMRGLNRPEAQISPIEVAEALTAIAGAGQRQDFYATKSVYVAGRAVELSRSPAKQVFTPEAVASISGVLRAGTKGLESWPAGSDMDLALKTGSSSNTYWVAMWSPRVVFVIRYLIKPAGKMDQAAVKKFLQKLSARAERVYAGQIVKPFAEVVLGTVRQRRPDWLRGRF